MRQELDGIVVQMRTIRTALRTHLRDAEGEGRGIDQQLVQMLRETIRSLEDSLTHLTAASYRAPSSF